MKYQDIETTLLIGFTLLFVWLERKWPKTQNLDVKTHLKDDVLAFIVLAIGVNLSRLIVTSLYDFIELKTYVSLENILTLPFIVKLFLLHLFSDFCLYWVHRGMHKWQFLWRTHQWHHSAESLYWLSGFRTSFMHAFLYAFPQILAGFYLFDMSPLEIGIGFGLGALANLFTHANIELPKWLPLHYFLVTPEYHHPHHSQMGTQNKNFGNVFTIWDRLFGTYVDPAKIKKDFKYGLKEKPSKWRMMLGL